MKRAVAVYIIAGAVATGMVFGHAMSIDRSALDDIGVPGFVMMFAGWPFTVSMYFSGVLADQKMCRPNIHRLPRRSEEDV